MNCPDCDEKIVELPGVNQIRAKKNIGGVEQRHEIEVEDVLYCDKCGWYQVIRTPATASVARPPHAQQQVQRPTIIPPAEMSQKIAQAAQSAGTFLGQIAQMAEGHVKAIQQVAAAPRTAFAGAAGASLLKQGESGIYEYSYGPNENVPSVRIQQAAPETWMFEILFGSGNFTGYGKTPELAMKNAYGSLRSWLTGIVHVVSKQAGIKG